MAARKSAAVLGARQAARLAGHRVVTDVVKGTVGKGFLGSILIAAAKSAVSHGVKKVG